MMIRFLFFVTSIFSFQAFGQMVNFTANRAVQITKLGPILVTDNSQYKNNSSKGQHYVTAADGSYRMDFKRDPGGNLSISEVFRVTNGTQSNLGWAQAASFDKNNQVESASKCFAADRFYSVKAIGLERNDSKLTCATATAEVCAQINKIGAISMREMGEKIQTCTTMTQVQSKLAELMREKNYLKASRHNLMAMSDSYMTMVRPNPSTMNKILDGQDVKPAKIKGDVDFNLEEAQIQGTNLLLLFSSCEKLREVSTSLKSSKSADDAIVTE